MLMYPQDVRDLEALRDSWGIPISSIAWSVLHGWLQSSRREGLEVVGSVVDALKLAVRLGMEDEGFARWLRFEMSGTGATVPGSVHAVEGRSTRHASDSG